MDSIEVSRIELVEGGNVFKQGHFLTLGYIPYDESGAKVDLTGKTLGVVIWGRKGIVFEAPATFGSGVLRFILDEILPSGEYQVEFTATSTGGYRKKFPANANTGRIRVEQSADDLGNAGVSVITVSQLRSEQEAKQQEFEQLIVPQVTELTQRVEDGISAFTEDTEVVDARMGEVNLRANLTKFGKRLSDITTVNIRDYGVISDGVTDQTAQLVNLFTTTLKDFVGTILIPFNTKFNITQIFSNAPVNSVIEDKSLINMYRSPTYKQKYYNIGSSDLVNNDFMFQVISGHHPALILNNLGTSNSVSGDKKFASILFAHGFNADGTQKNHMMQQSSHDGQRWQWTLRALEHFLQPGVDVDSTIFQINELGHMGINGVKSGYQASFQNNALDMSTTYSGGVFNKNNNSKAVWALGSKNSDGGDVSTSFIQNPDGRMTIQKGISSLMTFGDKGVSFGGSKTNAWKSISGVTPIVDSGIYFTVDNATPISMTNMTGVGDQEVTLLFTNANTTLVHGGFKLKDSVNWTPTAYSSITFIKRLSITSSWIEISRTEM